MVNISVQNLKKQARHLRRPSHTFSLQITPFAITPFFCAPVLPGETLTNLLYQCRAVTKPLTASLVGWWYETYFFYVPFSAMPNADNFKEMAITADYDASALQTSAISTLNYVAKGHVDYVAQCLEAVVQNYFRDEGETWNSPLLNSLPQAHLAGNNAFDSLMPSSQMTSYDETISTAGDDAFTVSELETAQMMYEFQRMNGMTKMDYETWLTTYGVKPQSVEQDEKPELLRFIREWQYPSNTVNPADGTVSTAVSWSLAERADKDRYFKQPGMLFGVSVVRPKVYISEQKGQVAGLMSNGFTWLPAVLSGDQRVSFVNEPTSATDGLFAGTGVAGGYWLDIRDLLMYGDQYVNHALNATDYNAVTPVSSAWNAKYCTLANVQAMFSGTDKFVRSDGIVSLGIKSSVKDLS